MAKGYAYYIKSFFQSFNYKAPFDSYNNISSVTAKSEVPASVLRLQRLAKENHTKIKKIATTSDMVNQYVASICSLNNNDDYFGRISLAEDFITNIDYILKLENSAPGTFNTLYSASTQVSADKSKKDNFINFIKFAPIIDVLTSVYPNVVIIDLLDTATKINEARLKSFNDKVNIIKKLFDDDRSTIAKVLAMYFSENDDTNKQNASLLVENAYLLLCIKNKLTIKLDFDDIIRLLNSAVLEKMAEYINLHNNYSMLSARLPSNYVNIENKYASISALENALDKAILEYKKLSLIKPAPPKSGTLPDDVLNQIVLQSDQAVAFRIMLTQRDSSHNASVFSKEIAKADNLSTAVLKKTSTASASSNPKIITRAFL